MEGFMGEGGEGRPGVLSSLGLYDRCLNLSAYISILSSLNGWVGCEFKFLANSCRYEESRG